MVMRIMEVIEGRMKMLIVLEGRRAEDGGFRVVDVRSSLQAR